jgi:hypothetical protein
LLGYILATVISLGGFAAHLVFILSQRRNQFAVLRAIGWDSSQLYGLLLLEQMVLVLSGLLPGSRWAEYELPPAYLPRSPGASTGSNGAAHARDWIRACKGGTPACSQFSVAAPYTEWLVLGAAAVHFEGKLKWDNAKGEFSNNKDANKWVKPAYRKGWELKV